MAEHNIADYSGCTVTSCARKMKPPREKSNYQVRDNCRHHILGECPFGRSQKE